MAHIDEMVSRLPRIYRDGEQVRATLASPATQLEILDEDAREVQRAHFFDSTLELREASMLAATLDIPAEPWQTLGTYGAWVHALRNARLRYGVVTIEAMTRFVSEYATGYQRAVGLDITPATPGDPEAWQLFPEPREPGVEPPITTRVERRYAVDEPLFIENPPHRVLQRAPETGGLEILQQFQVEQRGLDDAFASFLFVGIPGATESVPVVMNLTTGHALIYLGDLVTGARLWLRPTSDGGVEASLDGVDVTDRLRSVSDVTPGTPWSPDAVTSPAQPMRLQRGINELWFLTVAHYDVPGLDRVLLALSELSMAQGRYDRTAFDHSLFYQDPALMLTVSWVETRPASFDIRLPGGRLRRRVVSAGEDISEARSEAINARSQLGAALREGIRRLKGAGIDAQVHLDPFISRQPQQDRLAMIQPLRFEEAGSTGADRLRESGAVFDVTPFDDSSFR